jgi:hypothetical protein
LSDCPHNGKDEAIVLLSEYKEMRNADKKKANLKTLGINGAMADKRDRQTAFLTAENLGVKATVLAATGSDYSAIPRSSVEDARKRGFLSQGRGVAGARHAEHGYKCRKQQAEVQCDGDVHVSGEDHHAVGASVHARSAIDHWRRRNGPSVDWKAGLRRDEFRGESTSGLCTGQITLARLQSRWRGAIEDGQAAFGRPVKAFTQARGYSRVY